MGLRITRSQRQRIKPVLGPTTSKNSVWSARDLCPLDEETLGKPDVIEHVTPDSNGHMGVHDIARLFDRLWKVSRKKKAFVVELDMKDVRSVDARFSSELEFYRRELQRNAGTVRVTNGDHVRPDNPL